MAQEIVDAAFADVLVEDSDRCAADTLRFRAAIDARILRASEA